MDSRTPIVQSESTQSGDSSRSHNAVDYLQSAARSGRAALIPGALEPLHQDHQRIVPSDGPYGPDLSPVGPGDRARRERDREAGGIPADPVTFLDYVELMLLRLTDLVIRLLRTKSKSSSVATGMS
jgi:hypothetical protein